MVSGMLTCREASRLISESQDRKLRLHERLGLRMHLWMCINCRRFERQISMIRRLLRSPSNPETPDSQDAGLPSDAQERIRQAMIEREKSGR